MVKFQVCYFERDGYKTMQFNSEKELNDFVENEEINEEDIVEILEIEIKRRIFSKDINYMFSI